MAPLASKPERAVQEAVASGVNSTNIVDFGHRENMDSDRYFAKIASDFF